MSNSLNIIQLNFLLQKVFYLVLILFKAVIIRYFSLHMGVMCTGLEKHFCSKLIFAIYFGSANSLFIEN